ncbi:GNAT family N-acetyltransferase [Actinopolymorpha singaporensis]|uniref:Protein N-acetyltransferase, RimJ/RimL family n=1 Tax=Actinopolymorpha singaporensis TaxID=117157 RepID=A0A1H1NKC3_9ACTN|nr:GNAT family protein [Actinopolymorpha singaporensis]SDR99333.1 Protein N-acetyltransferase, RimJ/RimL family [Actinopolymorpha singaporensis]
MAERLSLRAFLEADLDVLDRLCTDPEALGAFEWHGFVDPKIRRRRFEKDSYVGEDSTALAVTVDGEVAGLVSWRGLDYAGPKGTCLEVGVALLPEHRGNGLGAQAHRVLVDHLFRYTTVHRLEARVESGNLAEERTLEKVGFRREGVLREVCWRDGAWRDGVIYGLLRADA